MTDHLLPYIHVGYAVLTVLLLLAVTCAAGYWTLP